ncbi:hypothetical protein HMPREF1373_01342, partial [Enterococcus faecium P1140]
VSKVLFYGALTLGVSIFRKILKIFQNKKRHTDNKLSIRLTDSILYI